MAWFAVYTASRAEKKVKERLDQAGFSNYLPLRTEVRIWSDRKKKVEIPLVTCYIFVNVTLNRLQDVCRIDGVINSVREFGKPIEIPDNQIERLRLMAAYFSDGMEFTGEKLKTGDPVAVRIGDTEIFGEMVEFKGKYQMMVRLDGVGCALTAVPLSMVRKLEK